MKLMQKLKEVKIVKKNINKEKVSDFKNNGELNFDHLSSFCMKTKPNNRYYSSEIKRVTNEFLLSSEGQKIKQEDPARYDSMKGQKIQKKHQKPRYPTAPVNAYVPPQSKLSKEELEKQMDKDMKIKKEEEQKALEVKKQKEKEAERLRAHREAVARERSIIYVCNAYDNHRWINIRSEAYDRKYNKKNEYY
jgi:hypothetical protein